MTRSVRTIIPIVCFAGILSAGLAQTGDVRLSIDPSQPVLPEAIRIQSSARIDRTTLCAWGSTVRRSDGAVINVLYLQVVRDTSPVGTPILFTDTAARPSGMLQVEALSDRFVASWDDLRSGRAERYGRLIDLDGRTIGPEFIVHGPRSRQPMTVIETVDGALLVWTDTTGGAHSVAAWLDVDGTLSNEILSFDPLPMTGFYRTERADCRTILDRGDSLPRVFDSAGTERAISAAARVKFSRRFSIREDGLVATLSGFSMELFESALSATPFRTIVFPVPAGTPADMTVPTFDRHGHPTIVYARYLERSGSTMWPGVDVLPMTQSEIAAGVFSRPRFAGPVVSGSYYNQGTSIMSYSFRSSGSARRIGPGTFDLRGRLFTDVYIWAHDENIYRTDSNDIRYFVTPDGALDGYPTVYSPRALPIRVNSRLGSEIMAHVGDTRINLVAPAASDVVPVAQRSPMIAEVQSAILVTWQANEPERCVRLTRWDGMSPATDSIDVVALDRQLDPNDRRAFVYGLSDIVCGQSTIALTTVRSHWPGGMADEARFSQNVSVMTATPAGWRMSGSLRDTSPQNMYLAAHPVVDPNTGRIVAGIGRYHLNDEMMAIINRWSLLTFDRELAEISRVEWLRSGNITLDGMMPEGDDGIVVPNGGRLLHFDHDSLISISTAPEVATGWYRRLLGERYIALGSISPLRAVVRGLDGALQSGPTADLATGVRDPFMLQHPSDSTILLIYGGSRGLRLCSLDPMLNVRMRDVLISESLDSTANPSAMLRGDTLFVVWENIRNGTSDIYGRGLLYRSVASVDEIMRPEEDSGVPEGPIVPHPNPATSSVTITLPASRTERYLTLTDLLGSVVIAMLVEPDESNVDVDLHSLPSGCYILRDGPRTALLTIAR